MARSTSSWIDRAVKAALLAPFIVAMVIHGSTKPGPGQRPSRFVMDEYLTDAGSYSTNSTVHIAATKLSAQIPDDTPLLAYAALMGTTNWLELLPRRTYADLPADWSLPDATNYDYIVGLDWAPPTPVVTNDNLLVNALAAKDSTPPGPTLSAVLPGVATSLHLSAAEYVQDGLIAMWDGIENAGWGVHDPNATTWTNLAQDKWHLWVNPVVVWTDNAARKPTMDGFNIATNGPALTAAEEALARTVELVVTWTGEWQHTGNSYNKVAMLFNWGQAGNGGKTFFLSGADANRFSVNSRPVSGTRLALSGSLSDIPVNQPFQLSADFAERINARPTRFALNGVAVTGTTFIGRDGVAGITLGGPVAHHYYLLGDIHCVRVYDRVITADEAAHNLEIDRNRFKLP